MPQPLQTWLIKSYLTPTKNNSSLLLVQPDYLPLINNTYYLSQIYPLARQVYSDLLSLHVTASTLYDFIKDETILFEAFELEL